MSWTLVGLLAFASFWLWRDSGPPQVPVAPSVDPVVTGSATGDLAAGAGAVAAEAQLVGRYTFLVATEGGGIAQTEFEMTSLAPDQPPVVLQAR